MLIPAVGNPQSDAITLVEITKSGQMQVDAILFHNCGDALLQRVASPIIQRGVLQKKPSKLFSNLCGRLAIMLACHVDLVIVSDESLKDRAHSTCFDAHHFSHLSVRVDGSSIEPVQTAVPMPNNCPHLLFCK